MSNLQDTESNELINLSEEISSLVHYMPEHMPMLQEIKENLPEIHRGTSLFGKTQSQFMDNMLTLSHPTPIRNLRQILSEIEKSSLGLKEAHFKNQKQKVELKIKLRDIEKEKDDLKRDLLFIESDEIRHYLHASTTYISGAIRKITNLVNQYNSIKKNLMKEQEVSDFNEIDFEKEEEKYHIMKAFEQALSAARSRNGVVDEGNMIYFQQIGINGAVAQKYITDYLLEERQLLSSNKAPTHKMTLNFLNEMAEIFNGSSATYAEHKGMSLISENALLTEGDTRLLDDK